MVAITLYEFDELSPEAKENAIGSGKERYRDSIDAMVAQYVEDYLQQRGYAFDSFEYSDDGVEITWEIPRESPLMQGCTIGHFVIQPAPAGHKVECLLNGEPVPASLAPTEILRQIEDDVQKIVNDLHSDLKPQIDHLYGDSYAEENLRAEKGLLFFEDGSPVIVPDNLIKWEA
ncbi:hypothetical protein KI811_06965 [Geobacter hydrogenophilus]|uniref:Uncharacterized protein n=1 Tax=Geobacter hydrogenophilus TaxID=40983 RepID=A0A9W6FZP7_9BACT|nr:hypothetical protein [Geobacter hydrogenophilus]MBT0893548.1 hypothetical protein [Geobacter hydrogenophilus]GLI37757.1 hypothetical protein GHYDROH2_12580 [Geobacter hydrogenophilus]